MLSHALIVLVAGYHLAIVPAHGPASSSRLAVAQRSEKAQVERALAAYNARVAAMAHDSVAATYTADGEMGETGQPLTRGREAIRARLASFSGYRVLANRLVADSTRVKADTARQWGSYWQRVRRPAGDTVEARGTFAATWQRQGTGSWQIRRMIATPQR
jgi:ketosteroid isomerase-like protein